MAISSLFGPGMHAVETAMRFRETRQSLLSANITNADTPGYRRVDLGFDDLLGEANLRMTGSDPRHITPAAGEISEQRVERGDFGSRPDRNGVDLDHELIELAENASAFQQQAEVLSRLLSLRRIAVTGEPR